MSDTAAPGVSAHPHRNPGFIALVALGGAAGSLVRALVADAMPASWGLPYATLAVNVLGAFLLGLLFEALVRSDQHGVRSLSFRLGLGTGFLGGMTTYSLFATEVALLGSPSAAVDLAQAAGLGLEAHAGGLALALGYALVTITAGLAAAFAGVGLGARIGRAGEATRT